MADQDTQKATRLLFGLLQGGSVGVGLVLVLLPAVALFCGIKYLEEAKLIGLPLVAIFGIMILFGSLALVAMLFQSLDLADRERPLALPEGSIRAAIALSLIVLFAILSIMLFQGMTGAPLKLDGLTLTQYTEVATKFGTNMQSSQTACKSTVVAGVPCPPEDIRYNVVVLSAPGSPAIDLAKQLLILVGTLMTSVTSFYFAYRDNPGNSGDRGKPPDAAPKPPPDTPAASDQHHHDEHEDGCDVPITDITPDDALPKAEGKIAPREN